MTEKLKEIKRLPFIDMSKLINTLRALMKQHDNINETQLARAVNAPQPTIHRILSGQVTDPRISTLNMIAQYFDISLDQLLGNAPIEKKSNTKLHLKPVPVISWNEAVNVPSFIKSITPQSWKKWITIDLDVSPLTYALISKPSMSPRFPVGAVLIVDPETKPDDGDLVIVHFKETDNATIREIIIDGRLRELRSILSDMPTESVTDEHQILGVLIQTQFSYRQ